MIGSEYFNQDVTWKSRTSVNAYNEPTYTSSTIKARFEYKRKLIRDATGEEVVSMATCFTQSAVEPEDTITFGGIDWRVISVSAEVDLFGNVNHYEVMV